MTEIKVGDRVRYVGDEMPQWRGLVGEVTGIHGDSVRWVTTHDGGFSGAEISNVELIEDHRDAGAAALIGRKEVAATPRWDALADARGIPRYETKDSGTREEFPTGSRRDSRDGKGRYDLLSPIAVARVAGVMERGAAKYGDRNWEKGQPLSRYLDSALRHTFQVLAGDTDEDHAGQAVWNLMAFMHTQEKIIAGDLPAELDNLDA